MVRELIELWRPPVVARSCFNSVVDGRSRSRYVDGCVLGGVGRRLDVIGGRRVGYYARISPRITAIFYAEALGIFSAIVCAVEHPNTFGTQLRRLVVMSDSALCCYAFSAGPASAPVNSLIWSAFDLLESAKIDLHVRHISGVRNTFADDLSRLPVDSLRHQFGLNLHLFIPPLHLIRGVPQ